jgi:hypothetical protein
MSPKSEAGDGALVEGLVGALREDLARGRVTAELLQACGGGPRRQPAHF